MALCKFHPYIKSSFTLILFAQRSSLTVLSLTFPTLSSVTVSVIFPFDYDLHHIPNIHLATDTELSSSQRLTLWSSLLMIQTALNGCPEVLTVTSRDLDTMFSIFYSTVLHWSLWISSFIQNIVTHCHFHLSVRSLPKLCIYIHSSSYLCFLVIVRPGLKAQMLAAEEGLHSSLSALLRLTGEAEKREEGREEGRKEGRKEGR